MSNNYNSADIDKLLNKAESLVFHQSSRTDKNFDDALEYCIEALNKGTKIKYMAGVARALGDMGSIYQEKKAYEKAVEYFEKAAEMWDKMNQPLGVAIVFNNMSAIFRDLNQMDKAIAYLEKAIEIKRKYDNEASLAKSLRNMAEFLRELGKVEESIEYYKEAIHLKLKTEGIDNKLKIPDSMATLELIFNVAEICNSLAASYNEKKKYEIALKYNSIAIEMHEIMEKNGFVGGLAECYYKRAEIYFYLKYFNKSLKLYQQYIEYLDKHDYPKGRMVTLTNMGLIYQIKSDYDKALEFYNKAMQIAVELLDDDGISKIQKHIDELTGIETIN